MGKRESGRASRKSGGKSRRSWLTRWLTGGSRDERKSGGSRGIRPSLRLESLESRLAMAVAHEIGDHIHPFLKIIVDGQEVPIPANVGITPSQHFSPHTHDATGKLHVGEGLNAGIDQTFRYVTLKDFFDVWRTTNVGVAGGVNNTNAFFSSTRLMDKVADATHSVFMTVNGVANTEFENYIPEDNDQIVLTYGASAGAPTLATLPDTTLLGGSPLLVPLDGYDPTGGPLTFTVTSTNPIVTPTVIANTTSWRMDVDGFGQMVFQLLPDQAARPVERVVTLTNQGFYNGLTFHRIMNNFVIQGGDPAGNGTGGSQLGNFRDDFDVDLQHNRTGLLSFAKTTDDTNNSQFFVTEGASRHLDFNHSIFGVLVEGESVRDAISNVPTNASDAPLSSVIIDRATTYVDNQNAVLMLKAPEGATGTSDITVTVRDSSNNTFSRTFRVTISPDTANGGPFLNDVPAIRTTVNTPANFTVTSQDVEGNAVTYTAVRGDNLSSTVTVNASTGLVTATPPTGYVGNMLVRVSVAAATGQPNTTSDKADAELVTIAVAPAAPTNLDLPTVADSGSSSTDNITSSTSFSITINGVTNGATVKLFNGSTELGQATATGTSATIPVTNLTPGSYSLTATQTVSSIESDRSAALQVVVDTTAPVISSTAPTTARVAEQYTYNVTSAEEGTTGFRYELVTPPTGMVIDASTGVVAWTPTSTQTGAFAFGVKAIDAAGNSTTQNISVNVAQSAQIRLRLAVTDSNGNPLTSIGVGQSFELRGFAQDLRSNALGVYAAFLDVTFDSTMATVTGAIDNGSTFTVAKSGTTTTPGLIDEVGGSSASFSGTGDVEALVFRVPMTASRGGNLTFTADPADLAIVHEMLVFGLNTAVPTSEVSYGSVSVAVASTITVQPDTFNVNEDSTNNTLTPLANDSLPAGSAATLTITQVGATDKGGTVTIAADGKSVRYTPAANFNGAEHFTYTVTAGGETSTSTVTVTVQPVNDPPTAVADSVIIPEDSTNNILDVLANDLQTPDTGETLRVTAVATPTNGTTSVGPNGAHVVYTPRAGFLGTDTIVYTLSDGNGGTAQGTVTVTVSNSADPPVAVNDTATVNEDSENTTINVLANDNTGGDTGETLTITQVGATDKGGAVSIAANNAGIVYKPAANFFGTEKFTYTISDGTATTVGTVTVTVNNVNDAPVVNDVTQFVQKNVVNFEIDLLVANMSGPDPTETMTISAVTQPTHGTASISADGRFIRYTPTTDYVGQDTLTFTVRDAGGLTDTATLTITVRDFLPSTFSGFSFIDVNNDGVMQPNEHPLGGVVINLSGTDTSNQTVQRSVLTDASGRYEFADLPPGDYTVLQTQPEMLVNGHTVVGGAGSSTADNRIQITLAEDTQLIGNNFAERLAPTQLRVHDFLARSRVSYLTAAVNSTGAAAWTIPGPGWSGYSAISVRNSTATANSLEILATPTGGAQQQAVIAKSDSRVQTLGTASGATTYRIFGAATSFNFQSVSSSSGSSSGGSGEGESAEGEGGVGEGVSTMSATLAATSDAAVRDDLIAQLDAATEPAASHSQSSASSTSGASLLDFLARRRSTSTYADAIDAILGE
ncbi:MAG: tandem-95 repeat protein [Pirellulales bacterium]